MIQHTESRHMSQSKKKFLFIGNGSYLNKGCEAIVRGTVKILRNAFNNPKFVNANFDVTNPAFMPEETDSGIIHKPIASLKRWSPKWITGQILKRTNKNLANRFYFGSIKDEIIKSHAVLSVGGDNYSLDYGIPKNYINLDNYVRQHNKPLIIWGASVGPFDSNPEFAEVMHSHLKEDVTAIFVREERSLVYLHEHGIRDNVYLMSDPAFLMEPEPTSAGELSFDIEEGSIGLNLSPLMTRYVGDNSRENLIGMAKDVIEALHKKTDRSILLIPHVTSPHSNDYELLKDIQGRLNPDYIKHVQLVPKDLNAAKTKWIISKVSCLIASRTHATIAGFSTCVPTVSLAYSVKAYGINEKLFGHTDYIVRTEDFSSETIIAKAKFVLSQGQIIRKKLRDNMEQIRSSALAAGLKLKELIGS